MATFNRNVITQPDIDQLTTATTHDQHGQVPKSLDASPPGGSSAPPGGVSVPSADDYLTKLIKYVPLEILGAYLFIEGIVDSNVTESPDNAYWLGGLLIGILLITIPYSVRVLGIIRWTQIFMSLVGLAIYVFAAGGWFATTSWYEPWYAAIALPFFGLIVAIIRLDPLPTVGG